MAARAIGSERSVESINKVTAVSGEELEVSFFEETPEKPEVSTCLLPRKVKSKPIKQEVFPPMDWYNGAPVECGVCGQQVPRVFISFL